jgi:hypothetical protein
MEEIDRRAPSDPSPRPPGKAILTPPITWVRKHVYLLAAGFLVILSASLVADAFTQAPVPPGVDPAHWLSISFAYVGRPTAPDPTDRALFYPPLFFPILGGLVLAFGPLAAAMVAAVGLFAAYGASVVHMARRFLLNGPLQVALVGLAVLSGPILEMVFWGGYPNLLGLVLINEALVFLLLYLQGRRAIQWIAFYVLLTLTFLAHDLSFAILLSTVVLSAVFLVLLGQLRLRFFLEPTNLAGAALLGGTVVGYTELTDRLGIGHPNYLGGNASAYFIDQLGELFIPLAHDPILLPPGPAVFVPSIVLALLLAAAPFVALRTLVYVRDQWATAFELPLVLAGAWFAAALGVPGIGYLAGIPTDYTRFLYFLPLPFFLLAMVGLQSSTRSWWLDASDSASPDPHDAPAPGTAQTAPPVQGLGPSRYAGGVIAVILLVLLATVAIPVIDQNEASATVIAHDQNFLSAMAWLKSQPGSGSVLTVSSASRWTEALSDRRSFTVGPEWLLFDQFEITDTQESYWALTSQYSISDGPVALEFSGFSSPSLAQAPLYVPFVDGVEFPVISVPPGSLAVDATGPSGNGLYPLDGNVTPTLSLGPSGSPVITATYTSPVAQLVERVVADSTGAAQIGFTLQPTVGETLSSFSLELTSPPKNSTILSTDYPTYVAFHKSILDWDVTGMLGQYPTPVTVISQGLLNPAPTFVKAPVPSAPHAWDLTFANTNGSGPFFVSLDLSTQGASIDDDALPAQFSTQEFLVQHSIQYLLWPTSSSGAAELSYFGPTFGFSPAYQNPEWTVLER